MNSLFIFNSDLRLKNNPALSNASLNGSSLTTVFIFNPKKWNNHNESNLKIAFQIEHLKELSEKLKNLNIPLKIINANGIEDESKKIIDFVKKNEIQEVFINKEYGVNEMQRDETLQKDLERMNKKLNIFDSSIFHPDSIKTQSDTFFKVFTPFSRAFRSKLMSKKIEISELPKRQEHAISVSDRIESFKLDKNDQEIFNQYEIGEEKALEKLESFIDHKILNYKENRDFPSLDGTSALSPYLSSGILSSGQCIFYVFQKYSEDEIGVKTWVNEIIWREFYKYILFHNPRVSKNLSFSEKYDNFPWLNNEDNFISWSKGQTGVPIIDAAMRQLNASGWMHNRLRMIVAMYLTKNLLIDWRKGENIL